MILFVHTGLLNKSIDSSSQNKKMVTNYILMFLIFKKNFILNENYEILRIIKMADFVWR